MNVSKSAFENRFLVVCLFILTGIAIAVSMALTRKVMIPFVLALFLNQMTSPIVRFLHKGLKLPRVVALSLAAIGGIALIVLVVVVVASSFRQLLISSDLYAEKILSLMDLSLSKLDRFGLDMDRSYIMSQFRDLPFFSMITQAAGKFVNVLSTALLVLIFMMFLVSGKKAETERTQLVTEIDERIRRYLVTKVVASAITGLLVAFILLMLGLEMAPLFGLLAFLLNFIPTLGSVVATLLPLPVIILQFDSVSRMALALLLPGIVQFVIGNVIEPRFMGKNLDLHPVTVLLALMLWTLIWGVPGAFLAVPITAILKIAFERVPATQGIAELMAGRLNLSSLK